MARTKEEIMSALTRLKDYSRYFVDTKNGERIELDGIQELYDETIKLLKSQPDVVRCKDWKRADMKVSKTGIKMYEKDDEIEAEDIYQCLGKAVNLLREEVNVIALVLDRFQDEIDKLKGERHETD